MTDNELFPSLPLDQWINTKETLHRYLQIVGKLRMSLMPKANHWWHITLYVSNVGISTGPIPNGFTTFEVEFNFTTHRLNVTSSNGEHRFFDLKDGLSVADFYKNLKSIFNELAIKFNILAKPYDLGNDTPFDECTMYHSYDKVAVSKAWKILMQVDMIFKEFSGKSYSKTCPSHIYWHHLDLVVTRFSGKKGPELNTESNIEKEAYSHEVISFGFWFGDDTIKEPAFYSYTYPSPVGIENEVLNPKQANWQISNGSPMAILYYEEVRSSQTPKKDIMDFLESSYQAGAKLSNWSIKELTIEK